MKDWRPPTMNQLLAAAETARRFAETTELNTAEYSDVRRASDLMGMAALSLSTKESSGPSAEKSPDAGVSSGE